MTQHLPKPGHKDRLQEITSTTLVIVISIRAIPEMTCSNSTEFEQTLETKRLDGDTSI